MKLFLKSLFFNISFLGWTLLLAIMGLPSIFGNRQYVHTSARRWGQGTNFLLKHILDIEVEFRGLGYLKGGPHLIACKHQSVWETCMIESLVPDCTIVLKRELSWIPFFGLLLITSGMICIDRKKGTKVLRHIVEDAKKRLSQGRSVWIFPEGTRRSPGSIPHYKYGIFALYQNLNQPVIPIALNSGYCWGRRSFLKNPGKIILEVLPPIAPGLPAKEFLKQLETVIEVKSNELAPPPIPS